MNKTRTMATLKWALRIIGYQVAFGFFGLMFAPMLMSSAAAIRIPILGLVIAFAGYLMFMDGSYRGEKDTEMGERLDKMYKQTEYKPSAAELEKRYRSGKGFVGACFGVLPFFLVALYVAITAVPYAYTLQDLPGWLYAYMPHAEIGDALRYTASIQAVSTATDYLRIVTRFVLFPYVGLLGEMTDEGSLLFDRCAPLLTLIMPLLSAIGYQFGPARRKKTITLIEQAKSAPRKRLKKGVKERVQREKKQII